MTSFGEHRYSPTRTTMRLSPVTLPPMEAGLLRRDGLLADLAELVAGTHPGRTSDEEVTMFKSAGTALEDLAAARLAAG